MTNQVPPRDIPGPLARTAASVGSDTEQPVNSNQKIYKINKSMFASLCLVDAEIEMKGELSERTINLVRSVLATVVEEGAA